MEQKARVGVLEYLRQPEVLQPMELVYGVVHEPPAPRYGHQSVVTRLAYLLQVHLDAHDVGNVCVSPIDVVLDDVRALVVQPDIAFIARERLHIIRDQIWGPPDMVIEVLSPRTATRDRTTKVDWYFHYGVRECWLVDPVAHSVEVLVEPTGARRESQMSTDAAVIVSTVLPALQLRASQIFAS